MTTRKPKPKPAYSPLIEWPTEELKLVDIVVDHKEPTCAGEIWQVEAELPVAESLPRRGRITLH
jgi:hypothetical protein